MFLQFVFVFVKMQTLVLVSLCRPLIFISGGHRGHSSECRPKCSVSSFNGTQLLEFAFIHFLICLRAIEQQRQHVNAVAGGIEHSRALQPPVKHLLQ